jgi:hypothetical protein
MGVKTAAANSLGSAAGAIGGQSTCSGTAAPPGQIGLLFGATFSLGNVGSGIAECGLKGSIRSLTAPHGPLTSTNAVSATVGGGSTGTSSGLYTGTSSATSNYGALSVATHGNNLGGANPSSFSESGGFAIFNDQLTFTSPTQTNGSHGSVVYTFTIGVTMTTPVPSFPSGSENIAQLIVRPDNFITNNVFSAYTISHSNGTILGNDFYPGFTTGDGSVIGSGQFSTNHIPIVWGTAENLTVGLAATSLPQTGATLDTNLNAVLSGITVYGTNGDPDSAFKIDAASGSVYSAYGVSPVPEAETYAMLLAGLCLVGSIARRRKQIS